MASLFLDGYVNYFSWKISGLSFQWNTDNYDKAGIATSPPVSTGQTSLSGIIAAEEPNASSGGLYSTSTYLVDYEPGTYTFYGWTYSGGRYWPAGSAKVTVEDETIDASYTFSKTAVSITFDISGLKNGQYGWCFVKNSDGKLLYDTTTSSNYFEATSDDYSDSITIKGLTPGDTYTINVEVFKSNGNSSEKLGQKTAKLPSPEISISEYDNNYFKVKVTDTEGLGNIAFDVKVKGTNRYIAQNVLQTASTLNNYTQKTFEAPTYSIHWNTSYEVTVKIGSDYTDTTEVTTSNFLSSSISVEDSSSTNTTATVVVLGVPKGFYVNIMYDGSSKAYKTSAGTDNAISVTVTGLVPGKQYYFQVEVTSDPYLTSRTTEFSITTSSPTFDCRLFPTKIIVTADNVTGNTVSFYVYEGWRSDESIDDSNNYGYDVTLNGSTSAVCSVTGLIPGTNYTVNISNGTFTGTRKEVTTPIPTFDVTDVGELKVSVSVTNVEEGDDITVFIRTGSNTSGLGQTTCNNVVYSDSGENRYSFSSNSSGVGIASIKDIYGNERRIQPNTLHSVNIRVNNSDWLNGGGTNGNLAQEFTTDPLSTTYTRTSKRDSITFNVTDIPYCSLSPSYVWFYINRVDADGNKIEEIITSATDGNNIEVSDGSLNKTFTSAEYPGLAQGFYYVCNVHIKYDGVTHELGRSMRFGLYERPKDWEWTSTIAKDSLIRIRAEEWNNFTGRINAFRLYSGIEESTFTEAIGGVTKIGATICNQAYSAIYDIDGHGTLPAKAVAKNPVSASFFNKLMTALNAVP